MSNPSVSNDGKDRTDDKVALVAQESRVESHLPPPPPPLDPSSSSSSPFGPHISHDPSQPTVKSSSASGDPVAAQIAQLFSLVGRLSSENELLRAQVAFHSSSIARLSSENEELRKRDEEKEKTMSEMTKAFGSHWVWEAGRGEEKGRWLWSGEKYRRAPPRATGFKAPPYLDSLPVELSNSITSLVGRPEHLTLCQVSFNVLGKTSPHIYRDAISIGSKRAVSFVSSRNHTSLPHDNRISPLLLPSTLVLNPSGFDSSHFALLTPTHLFSPLLFPSKCSRSTCHLPHPSYDRSRFSSSSIRSSSASKVPELWILTKFQQPSTSLKKTSSPFALGLDFGPSTPLETAPSQSFETLSLSSPAFRAAFFPWRWTSKSSWLLSSRTGGRPPWSSWTWKTSLVLSFELFP